MGVNILLPFLTTTAAAALGGSGIERRDAVFAFFHIFRQLLAFLLLVHPGLVLDGLVDPEAVHICNKEDQRDRAAADNRHHAEQGRVLDQLDPEDGGREQNQGDQREEPRALRLFGVLWLFVFFLACHDDTSLGCFLFLL